MTGIVIAGCCDPKEVVLTDYAPRQDGSSWLTSLSRPMSRTLHKLGDCYVRYPQGRTAFDNAGSRRNRTSYKGVSGATIPGTLDFEEGDILSVLVTLMIITRWMGSPFSCHVCPIWKLFYRRP